MRMCLACILSLTSVLFNCGIPHSVKEPVSIPRDTTITMQNAYSDLFLDSLAVESFISTELDDSTLNNTFRNFYKVRNYEFAWFNEDGLTLQAEGFWNALDNHLQISGRHSPTGKELKIVIDSMLYHDSVYLDPALIIKTELRLTKHFFIYAKIAYGTETDPEEFQWHVPKRKLNVYEMIDSVSSKRNTDWQPLNKYFIRLQNTIRHYREIEQQGGWQEIEIRRTIKKGDQDSVVKQIKRRLAVTGHFTPHDTSAIFTDSLQRSITKVQGLYGISQTGLIDKSLIKELNISVVDRIKQMLLNLERIKWMPPQPEKCVIVNIPEYRLHVFEKRQEIMRMNVVVGKSANRTVVFSDEIKYVVFSPYWNIPSSIVRNEILPAMNRNKNYLRRNNMEITGYAGGLPVIRQKPGRSNALGRVKFLFPNNYNIYLHDTPAKSLFERDKRAFSHGCIRIERPFDLAKYLLSEDSAWTSDRIQSAMNKKVEMWVTIAEPIPVYIVYFTSWVDDQGNVHFREDIYGHDRKLASRLFN